MSMKPAKDMTTPARGALNRSGSTMNSTVPKWKARVSRPFTRMVSNIKSSMKKKG